MITAEHEKHDTLTEDVFYPDHEQRTESPTFKKTKAIGHGQKLPCCISGHTEKTEYHHVFCEWAFTDGVDWTTVKKIANGEIKQLPVLDPHTDLPTGDTFPANQSLIYIIVQLAKVRGFDWQAFDPSKPELFIDSMENMLVLHEKFHRHKDHGIHVMSFPEWLFQAFPRRAGFVFTPDEQ